MVDGIEEFFGKVPSSIGNIGILEKSHVSKLLFEYFNSFSPNSAVAPLLFPNANIPTIDNFNIDNYAMSILILMRDRNSVNQKGAKERQKAILTFSNEVIEKIGFNSPVILYDFLSLTMSALSFLKIYLDEVFSSSSVLRYFSPLLWSFQRSLYY